MGLAEDIESLDIKLTRLKTEYEQYFARVRKREPVRLREEVEKIVMRNSNVPITNTVLKFKFSSLISKYVSYKQYWTRVLREIEEGTYRRRAEAGAAVAASSASTPPAQPADEGTELGLKGIYEQYIDALTMCGEPSNGIPFEKFSKALEEQKKRYRNAHGVEDVEVKICIKDGKAKISLAPGKPTPDGA